ncbi:zinc finger and BTB domain-containing protein 32 isoform X1 [Ochotona princeps]|uniref:zinc finger and BTB domain-containing protein 32 isoform X1 n=1 Tax=Ochotona princeps TaxID=9978 RepID=UPI00271555E2|nr:zinc finger and BTB domain-containing protein 32 isoform X1 [Ochotona princeps]
MSLPPSKLISPYGSDRLVRLAATLRPALCDTLITVGDQEFPAHSLVLAGVSQQLGRRGKWTLAEGISSSTFAQLLSFVYGESVELQSRELGPLEQAAKVLGVQALEEACRQAQRDRTEELDHGLKNHEEEPEQPTGDPKRGKEAQKPGTCTSVGRESEMPHQHKLPRDSPEMPEAKREGQGQWQPTGAKEESRSQSLPGHGGAYGKQAAVLRVNESSRGSEESLREFPGPLPPPGSLWAFDLPGPRWAEAPWLREGQPALWNMLLWPPRYGTPFSHSTPSTGTWQKLWPLHQRIPLSLNAPKGLWSQNQLASSRPTPGSLPQGPAQLRPGETPQSQQGHPGVPTTCLDREGTTGHPLGQQPPLPPPARSRPYSCPVCGKRFSLKHQMETHHRVHTGEKPFSCGLCPQRSRDFSAMAKHLRTHGAAPYRCPLCGVGCSSLASMQAHMRSHSPSQLPPGWTIRSTFLYSSSSRPPRASTSPGSPSSACL